MAIGLSVVGRWAGLPPPTPFPGRATAQARISSSRSSDHTGGRRLFPDRLTAAEQAKAEGWDLGDGSYALCQPVDKGHDKQLQKWLGE